MKFFPVCLHFYCLKLKLYMSNFHAGMQHCKK